MIKLLLAPHEGLSYPDVSLKGTIAAMFIRIFSARTRLQTRGMKSSRIPWTRIYLQARLLLKVIVLLTRQILWLR